MLSNALPYQLKVRDFLRSESSVWEFYSMNSGDEWEITDRIIDAIFEKENKDSGFWHMAKLYREYAALSGDRAAGAAVTRLIERKQELGNLDVFDRERIRELTRGLIGAFLHPVWIRSAPVAALALEYFPDLSWSEDEKEETLESMAREHGSIRDFFAFVLIDFVFADPLLKDRSAERARNFAARLGFADSFAHLYNENYGKPGSDQF